MTQDLDHSAAQAFILETYSYYDCLMQGAPAADPGAPRAQSLGGRLLWVGELDERGRAMTVAGNVAGAATLAAESDGDAQRKAVREGIVDFLVNSLDEALRILKNEIRKRETVAVCVAAPLVAVEREMAERGVRPDIFREGIVRAAKQLNAHKEPRDAQSDPTSARALVVWRVDRSPALWLPKLDAIALECLGPDDALARRWLQRASRYLGRIGQALHLVWANREFAARLIEQTRAAVTSEEMKAAGRLEVTFSGTTDLLIFVPPEEGA